VIRLAWRQFSTQALVAGALLAMLAVLLAVTGPRLHHFYYTSGIMTCHKYGDCEAVNVAFVASYHLLQGGLNSLVLVVPAVIGLFWGAPLVAHELETGTIRLAWTQSVSRGRWLAVKLGVVGLAAVAVGGLMSLMVTWWSSPIDQANMNRFTNALFGERGITPIGYAAFAFALGVTAGVVIRRTLPAMATTLLVFVGARIGTSFWVRPHLAAPLVIVSPLRAASAGNGPLPIGAVAQPGDWVYSSQTVNAAGRVIGDNGGIGPNGVIGFGPATPGSSGLMNLQGVGLCPNRFPMSGVGARAGRPSAAFSRAAQECIDKLHIREVLTLQPATRYWAFQWYETVIFLGAALVLCGVCFFWVRHRLS
jgi:hypothetical protein